VPLDDFSYETPALKRLQIARDRVAAGWVQHTGLQSRNGRTHYCASMAVLYQGHNAGLEEAIESLCRAIGVTALNHVPTWNDAPDRTQAEVVAAYDRAIGLTC